MFMKHETRNYIINGKVIEAGEVVEVRDIDVANCKEVGFIEVPAPKPVKTVGGPVGEPVKVSPFDPKKV